MREIRWGLYPEAASSAHARAWVELQHKLLRAPKTIDAYARAITDFLRVCARLGIDIDSATRPEIASYVEDLAHRPRRASAPDEGDGTTGGLANRTLQLRLTAVRLFYDFLVERGVRDSNPVGRGRYTPSSHFGSGPRRGLVPRYERPPRIPTDAEWCSFVEVLLREEPLRNQLLAYLAYDGALRRSELLALTLEDVDFPLQQIRIRPETAKNYAGRVVCYSDATSDLLVAYVRHRQTLLVSGALSPDLSLLARPAHLFLSESRRNCGHPLGPEMWNKIVQRAAQRAGLAHFSTHTFRHLRLTDLARCRLDLHEIATYAGHRHFRTTHQYIQLSGTELAARVRQATQHLEARSRRLLEQGWHHAAGGAEHRAGVSADTP